MSPEKRRKPPSTPEEDAISRRKFIGGGLIASSIVVGDRFYQIPDESRANKYGAGGVASVLFIAGVLAYIDAVILGRKDE